MTDVMIKTDTGNHAPILPALSDRGRLQDFMNYIQGSIEATHLDVARNEQKRLSYYWEALDKRLTRGGPVEKGGAPKKGSVFTYLTPRILRDYKPVDSYRTGDLHNIFEKIATETRSIILAEVAICPQGLMDNPHIAELTDHDLLRAETAKTTLEPSSSHALAYRFGFLNILKKDEGISFVPYKSSITFPVLLLDDDMMGIAAEHQSALLLHHLQTIISLSNHDMIHNMINTESKADISHPMEVSFRGRLKRFMEDKTGCHGENDPLGFESALVVGHARTWAYLRKMPAGRQMDHAIEGFYDELARISQEIQARQSLPLEKQHQVIDYFSMTVPFALARMVPLNDPLMERAFQRMHDIDPAPDLILRQEIDMAALKSHPGASCTLKNYDRAGTPLIETAAGPRSYAEHRKLHLVQMLPETTILLSPASKGTPEYKAHQRADVMDRDIVNIIIGERPN